MPDLTKSDWLRITEALKMSVEYAHDYGFVDMEARHRETLAKVEGRSDA